jgi:hypothetical protein
MIVRGRLRADTFPGVQQNQDIAGQIALANIPRASNASRSFKRTRKWPRPLGDGNRMAGKSPDAIQRFTVIVLTDVRAAACAIESQMIDWEYAGDFMGFLRSNGMMSPLRLPSR